MAKAKIPTTMITEITIWAIRISRFRVVLSTSPTPRAAYPDPFEETSPGEHANLRRAGGGTRVRISASARSDYAFVVRSARGRGGRLFSCCVLFTGRPPGTVG